MWIHSIKKWEEKDSWTVESLPQITRQILGSLVHNLSETTVFDKQREKVILGSWYIRKEATTRGQFILDHQERRIDLKDLLTLFGIFCGLLFAIVQIQIKYRKIQANSKNEVANFIFGHNRCYIEG